MRIGVPRESKDRESRVGVIPDGVRTLVRAGHEVWVEQNAGLGSGFDDAAFVDAGAAIVDTARAWSEVELVAKVKEPNLEEAARLKPGQTLFAYLHLAPTRALTEELLARDVVAIAYETIQFPDGSFPVLAPMSEVAGRLAAQIGVTLLQHDQGGKGVLVGGVPGVGRGRVCVIGAGIVGINAVRIAHALGGEIDVFDIDLRRLSYVYDLFRGDLNTLFSNAANLARSVATADLVIGAVYSSGRRAPTLVSEEMVKAMEPGSVIVDVAVDQGGCIETGHVTTHSEPTYRTHDVIHYGVANMPAAVPRTSTFALTNTTLPYLQAMAERGVEDALRSDPSLALGVNIWRGEVVCPGVAEAHALPCVDLSRRL